ncbi:MAG: hypothetical protein AAF915_28220, partial [Cyanobacteria bacterium P01_D01_bin.50]
MQQPSPIEKTNSLTSLTNSSQDIYSSTQVPTDVNLDHTIDGYDYILPPELIAQNPAVPRDSSR